MKKKGLLVKMGVLIALACAVTVVGCGKAKEETKEEVKQEEVADNTYDNITDYPVATIVVKDYGTIEAELYPQYAPNTVKNFISLANDKFYDGLTFHRVIEGFMIQGGDPNGIGTGGPDYTIKGEFSNNGFTKNTLKHTEGVLSMARVGGQNDSAGSQFFIMSGSTPSLDGDYAAFGKVISGLDVVHKIEKVKTDNNDKPLEEVKIESITVDTKGVDYGAPEKISK